MLLESIHHLSWRRLNAICRLVLSVGSNIKERQQTQIKLSRHLITRPLSSWRTKQSLPLICPRIKIPLRSSSIQIQDRPDVILQHTIHIQTTCDQATRLKEIIVILGQTLSVVIFWFRETSIFVDATQVSI
jgi:hypothetical protein